MFNSLMSRKEVLRALLQLLPDQFKQPPEVAAEFGEGYVAPEEDAERLIAGRFVGWILTDEDFDVGFSLDQETAVHRLQGLWRRLRRADHERQPPYKRPGLRRTPLPAAVGEEYLDDQGLEPMALGGEAVRMYMAQLEEAVRIWWKANGPADILPDHYGRLVEPESPETVSPGQIGERWPTNSFLSFQIQTLWALERAERHFATGVDVSEPARRWLISQRATYFLTLHDPPQYAPDDRGRGLRYHSLAQPVDPMPRPTEQGTHLSRADDLQIVLELPHLQPKEMREMEMVLRSYWQVLARTANGQERFKGSSRVPPGVRVPSRGDGGADLQMGKDGEQPGLPPRDTAWGRLPPQ
jgi:hypothetical protein